MLALPQLFPVDHVNVFTGTSNSRWMIYPGVSLPFGMVKLSPDNQGNVWNGGYEYTVASISGFSHLHGMALSGVSYMPVVGNLYFGEEYAKLFPGSADGPFRHMWTSGYRSRFEKSTEVGKVGYYAVDLYDYDVTVELTATTRCGMMRITYPESDQAYLLLDLDPPAEELADIHETYVEKVSNTRIRGYITQSNQYADTYTVCFVSEFSKPITTISGWQYSPFEGSDTKYGTDWRRHCMLEKNTDTFRGAEGSGVMIRFETAEGEQVFVRTGISFVSMENAALNLETEMIPYGWNFDAIMQQAQSIWNDQLSTIEVQSRDQRDIETFYTNFYRSLTGKNILNDVNGEYMDMCEKIQKLDNPTHFVFSGDGFWGAQWTLFPFWTLAAPEWANAMSRSFLTLARHGGWIPEAPTGLEYAPIMGAQHHNALIISSYMKGISDFDIEKAYAAIRHDYTTQGINHPCGGYAGNRHLEPYMELGYVAEEYGPVSNTMEYAYDDWCLAQLAAKLGKKEDAGYFLDRSMNYRNVFDPSTGFIRRKHADGSWYEDFDPFREGTEGGWNGPGYMEGNAWIYTWFVPHDLPGLVGLMGRDEFNQRLEEGFSKGYVNLGNQPNLQAPFLFNYSGKPWLTQKYSRSVAETFFDLSPLKGWSGEEDEGQMGSLYCLLSMGLFDMKGGCSKEPYYDLSSPVFDRVVIHLENRKGEPIEFIIRTENNDRENVYIHSARLNGIPLERPQLLFRDILEGGELLLEMSDSPCMNNWK